MCFSTENSFMKKINEINFARELKEYISAKIEDLGNVVYQQNVKIKDLGTDVYQQNVKIKDLGIDVYQRAKHKNQIFRNLYQLNVKSKI